MPSAKYLVENFSDVKTLPHVAIRVTELINSENATMQDFEKVIKLDPVLVVRLLKLVNSPFFGLVKKVESISKAVVFVGMKNLRNLVAVEALRDLFREEHVTEGFSRKNLWIHSATVAILCQMIAKRIFAQEGEDAFLAGIIHDIGLIVEDQVIGSDLRRICHKYTQGEGTIIDFEDEIIGTNHCKIGARLGREWKLQDEILTAIKHHHNMIDEQPIPSLCSILQIAEYISGRMKYSTIPGRQDTLPPYLVDHMKTMMQEYKVLIKDLPGEIARAKELYEQDN